MDHRPTHCAHAGLRVEYVAYQWATAAHAGEECMSLHRLLGVGLLDKLEEEYLKGSLFVKLTKSLIGANKDQPIDVSAITAMHQLWYSSRAVCAVFGIGRT